MDEVRNPYVPGAGRTPAALVGRDKELRAWQVALERIQQGASAQPLALYGLRGVGKTVLLNRMRQEAEYRDWITAKVEAATGKPLRESLGEALHAPLSDLAQPSAGKRLVRALKTALSFRASYDATGTWNLGIDLQEATGGGADSGVLETDLTKLVRDLSGAAGERHVGLAILVDEAQDLADDEIAALCAVVHEAAQRDWSFTLALTGLPSLPGILAEAKSYAERQFVYYSIGNLPTATSIDALVLPARDAGNVSWDDDAAQHVVTEAGGYPYYLQQHGQEAWNEASGNSITLPDARVGVVRGTTALDNGFFRSRWDRATRAEQEYLRAMAADGDAGSQSGEVAQRLDRKLSSLGPARANLISKGLIYSPEHGRIAFTVPRMASFIQRQPTD